MVKTKTKDEEQQSSGLSVVLLFALGIAALVGLYAFSKMLKPTDEEAPELPLVSIMVEANLADANARAQIVALENDLRATGVFQNPYGPADVKVLVPGAKAGDAPIAKPFDGLTDAEWQSAWTYLAATEYLVPRLFRIDGSACVIRADPKGMRDFAPDAAPKIQAVCDRYKEKLKSVRVYSRAIGLGGAAERDALNASFGCQLSWISVEEPTIAGAAGASSWKTAAGVSKLSKVKGILKNNRGFRRVTTDANWVSYYWTVKVQSEKEVALPGQDPEVLEAFNFAQANRIGTLTSRDGKQALVDTSTDLEGQANVELIYHMAANLQVELKVECRHPYQPPIRHKFKGDGPVDDSNR